ncbi:Conserved protein of unknown function [endosymbiont DhMRE of Dentiscutata heterogama]|uniref:hypothetical protein n=1 Tax=endosymbiont DhMRE of Dentiscutata heterogama TaxID=1609546 RepID=UPI000629D2FA|nr:hypothetical protein [endosymbiont DhMRE of Dentiscutata heterogama]CFW92933.1 Conserved protein of unknown function [endosymbiont DhMRE of Dentiscutata heterogama]
MNANNYSEIYQTVLDNFYFSLIILDQETDSEIFMTLNTAGEDLTIPDLVKSLLTRRNDYQARQFVEDWEKGIVKKICPSPSSKKTRSDKVKRFLIVFWEVQENNCYKKTLDDKIKRFYRKKIKGEKRDEGGPEENRKFLDRLMEYAEIYVKVYVKMKENYHWWWKQNWSSEMWEIISGLALLDRWELTSSILAIYFQFRDKTLEEKLAITKELQKLVLYFFRAIIVKKSGDDESALRAIRINILEMVNSGQNPPLFQQERYPINLINKEFQSDSFYQALAEYQNKKNKEWEIEKFILFAYYQKKIKNRGLNIDLFDYEIVQLVSQNSEIEKMKDISNSLGNLTLVKKDNDHPLLPWNEKREIYNKLGDNCLLNLEEENWTEYQNINDLIEERKKYLLKEFKELEIFESN